MKCEEARAILSGLVSTGSIFKQKRAYQHLAGCQLCQAGLNRLAAEIGRQDQICPTVQEILPAYVHHQLARAPIQAQYPQIEPHLRECPACTQLYQDLRDLLQLDREGFWRETPDCPMPALPFLSTRVQADDRSGWWIDSRAQLQGRLSAVVTISRAYIQNVLFPQPPVWARSGPKPSPPAVRLPLLDCLLEEGPWLITVELFQDQAPSSAPDRWHLQLSIDSPDGPGQMEVRLVSGAEQRATTTNAGGQAIFRNVPLAWLSARQLEPAETALKIEIQQIER